MDRRGRLRAPDDIESNGLVRVAAEAANLKIAVPRIQRVAEHRRWLCWALVAEHAFVLLCALPQAATACGSERARATARRAVKKEDPAKPGG